MPLKTWKLSVKIAPTSLATLLAGSEVSAYFTYPVFPASLSLLDPSRALTLSLIYDLHLQTWPR